MPRDKRTRKGEAKRDIALEIATLNKRIQDEAPARGYAPPLEQRVAFRALPLSEATLKGLEQAKTPFTTMTAIQNACIPHALAGRDIQGASRTGSGKTLAFLIPVLEKLHRDRLTPRDGPAALILSPTRELAMQIFHVLRVVGRHHPFSVGLLIGGKKDFFDEQGQLPTTNIIVATPGRVLQHLEQTPYFDLSYLKLLVLDEADRILDMGFRDQMHRIIDYLPKDTSGDQQSRQSLLFSATQTKEVSQLAKLSLYQPEYLGVHDKARSTTPEGLQQSYVVTPVQHKLNAVYSFIKSHLKCKSIVFMASCAQIRHAWSLFCSLQPGVPVMALHGKLVQTKRTHIYRDFLQRPHAVLFATDIAARGLDFPNVDWVVQVDAPEDRAMYIHRVGRTARYKAGGKSLMMLTPAEEKKGFIPYLQGKHAEKMPLRKLSINPSKTLVVTQRAASLVASDVTLHKLAKKAFQSYVRSIELMPKKEFFSVQDLPLEAYGECLGLDSIPNKSRLLKSLATERSEYRQTKNVNRKLQRLKEQIKAEKLAKKLEKLGKKGVEMQKSSKQDDDDSDDDSLLGTKREWKPEDGNENDDTVDVSIHQVSKSRHKKKIRVEGSNSESNKHIVFNEDGGAEDANAFIKEDSTAKELIGADKESLQRANDEYMQKIRERLQTNFSQDRADEKERIRQKHKKRRLEAKPDKEEEGYDLGATLALPDPEEDNYASGDHSEESDDESSDEAVDLQAQEEMALSLIRGK